MVKHIHDSRESVDRIMHQKAHQDIVMLVSEMSHDMRTPLNVVIGTSSLLAKMDLKPKEKQMLETLQANAEILLQLLNQFTDANFINTKLLDSRDKVESSNFNSNVKIPGESKINNKVPLKYNDPSTDRTILLVEDYAPNVMVASMMLENMGFRVLSAENGLQALDLIASHPPFTAVLMDVQMQDMDGIETTRRVRDLERGSAYRNFIIGVTAHALAGDRERCISAGMDDYMSKPIHPDLLAEKLAAL